MNQININIPKGYEIDTANSNLAEGKIVFKESKPTLSKTWEEAFAKLKEVYYIHSGNSTISKLNNPGKAYIPSASKNSVGYKKQAESILALTQLLVLRDEYRNSYRQGWEPDWNNLSDTKYVTNFAYNEIVKSLWGNTAFIFSFPTEELAKEFLTNFKDLLTTYFEGIN